MKVNHILTEAELTRRGDVGITIEDDILLDVGIDVTDLVVPDSVKEIADHCCYDHSKLKYVKVGNNIHAIGRAAFEDCTAAEFEMDFKNIVELGAWTFCKCIHLPQNIVFSNNLVKIGPHCFYCAESLRSVVFEGQLDSLPDSVFCGALRLNNIILPKNLKIIEDMAFFKCSSLKEIELPNTLQEIRFSAFDSTGLTHIELPEGLVTTGAEIFMNCKELAEVSIPSTLRRVSDQIFSGCKALKRINYAGTKDEWRALPKSPRWDKDTGSCTIHCVDGDINKAKWRD